MLSCYTSTDVFVNSALIGTIKHPTVIIPDYRNTDRFPTYWWYPKGAKSWTWQAMSMEAMMHWIKMNYEKETA